MFEKCWGYIEANGFQCNPVLLGEWSCEGGDVSGSGSDVEEGMIIAARLGEDATIKTYTHRDGHVVLVPANPEEHEIIVNEGDDFAIIGKVCVREIHLLGQSMPSENLVELHEPAAVRDLAVGRSRESLSVQRVPSISG